MQERTCKKYKNKVGMKSPQVTLLPNMEKNKDKEDYTTSIAKMCHAIDLVQFSLCFFFAMFGSRVAQGASNHTLFPYFFQVLPYMNLSFTDNFLPLVSFLFCHVKIGNTGNSPNKVARHAVCTCCTVKGCNIVSTYLYTTAANDAHLTTNFTLHKQLCGYFLINHQYTKFFHSTYEDAGSVAGATRRVD